MTGALILFKCCFWLAFAFLLLNYFGVYPLTWLLVKLARRKPASGGRVSAPVGGNSDDLPTLTVLVPVRNEERLIRAKLENLLSQSYPDGKLKIIVGSDASTDRTDETVRNIGDDRVELRRFESRKGKLGILDTVIPTLTSEIVAITDANVQLEPDALLNMAEYYRDPKVGAVCCKLRLRAPAGAINLEREVGYRDHELGLKRLMGEAGVVIGVFGGFYSIKVRHFTPIGPTPCDDDIILPMNALAHGSRVVYAHDAAAVEDTNPRLTGEFHRRARMIAYNFNALPRMIRQAAAAGLNVLLLTILYKVFRWFSPYFLGVLLLAAAMLVWFEAGLIYELVLLAYGLVLALGVLGWLADQVGLRARILTLPYQFLIMNLAGYAGLVTWLRGVKPWWTPRGA